MRWLTDAARINIVISIPQLWLDLVELWVYNETVDSARQARRLKKISIQNC